ncbi:nucleotidyltransferase family protein [Bacillus cereus]
MQNSSMQAQTIKRFASHYHDETFNDQHIASATSIRKQLLVKIVPLQKLSLSSQKRLLLF